MNKTVNIAICNAQEFNPQIGGIERVSVCLASELIEKGFHVIFVACIKSPYTENYKLPCKQYFLPTPQDYAEENVRNLIELLQMENISIIINQNAHSLSYHKMCREAASTLKLFLVSALHFCPDFRRKIYQDPFDSTFFSLRENISNTAKKILLSSPFSFFIMMGQRKQFKIVYEESDLVVLLSSEFIEDYLNIAHINTDKKIRAIPNMITLPIAEHLTSCEKENRLLFCARLTKQKRQERCLYIWKKLMNDFPEWELDIVGDGDQRYRLEELSDKIELQRVNFYGFQDPTPFYERSKIFLMTSDYEGWGLTISESMQHGCVPVAYETFGSIKEMIVDGKTGFLVKPFRIDEYVEDVKKLMTHEEKLRSMSAQGYRYISKFSPHLIANMWIDLLNSLSKCNK